MIKSKVTGSGSGGKGQGKSRCARMILFLSFDIESHSLDPELSKEEIKKYDWPADVLVGHQELQKAIADCSLAL